MQRAFDQEEARGPLALSETVGSGSRPLSKNPEAKKQKTLNGCLEDGHLYPPEFFECIFQQCGPKMIGSCDQYLDDIDFCYKTPVEEGGCKE